MTLSCSEPSKRAFESGDGDLVAEVIREMKLAGEAGSLLKIEETDQAPRERRQEAVGKKAPRWSRQCSLGKRRRRR